MATMRLNIPTVFVSGGPMAAGIARTGRREGDLPGASAARDARSPTDLRVQRRSASCRPARSPQTDLHEAGTDRLPDLRFVLRHVHGQFDELPLRSARHGAARQRHDPGRLQGTRGALRARRAARSSSWSRRTSSRATSRRSKRSTTPSRSTSRWAARPTPSSTRWPSRARPASITTSHASTPSRRRVPCLCKVSPSSDYHVQDVHRAGGIHTILGELKRHGRADAIGRTCKTVTTAKPSARTSTNGTCARKDAPAGRNASASPAAPPSCWTRTTSSGRPRARRAAIWRPSRCCSSRATNAPSRSGAWPRRSTRAMHRTPARRFTRGRGARRSRRRSQGAAEIRAAIEARLHRKSARPGSSRRTGASSSGDTGLLFWQYAKAGEKTSPVPGARLTGSGRVDHQGVSRSPIRKRRSKRSRPV